MRNVANFKKKSQHLPFALLRGAATFRPGARRAAAAFLCAAGLLALPAPASAAGAVEKDQQTASPVAGDLRSVADAASGSGPVTFAVNGVTFHHDANAVLVSPGITVIRGGLASGFRARIATLGAGILLEDASRQDASSLANAVGDFFADTLSTRNGMTYIKGDTYIRVGNNDTEFNNKRWLTISSALNLENLYFHSVEVTNTFSASSAGGMTNGLIGSASGNTKDIAFGNLTGNIFENIIITFAGYQDTHYLAGGGVIGFRATGETLSAGSSASVEAGEISGNIFTRIDVTTTGHASGDPGESAYIEGGGLIGLDAVSSPTEKITGHAYLPALNYNLFTDIEVKSGDVILGGGLVGLNNNSKSDIDDKTYIKLEEVVGNIFGGDKTGSIAVAAGYSLRGGGVIGLNGLTNASAELDRLKSNIFAGVNVSVGSYLRGGGIVGLNTNDGGDGKLTPGDLAAVNTYLNEASGNLFINSSIAVGNRKDSFDRYEGGNLEGGGIIGLRSNTGWTSLNFLKDNIFKDLTIATYARDSSLASGKATNGGDLLGGGVVGLSSQQYASLAEVENNWFGSIEVSVGRHLQGGGLIGAYAFDQTSAPLSTAASSTIGVLSKNTFYNSSVTVTESLYGGGAVGVYAEKAGNSSASASTTAGIVGLSDSIFDELSIHARDITGGGIVGVYAKEGSALLVDAARNQFTNLTIATDWHITGGGVLGVYSDNYLSLVGEISGSLFGHPEKPDLGISVTAGTYIDGGGLIGATGLTGKDGEPTQQVHGISLIEGSTFANNAVTAQNGQIMGGAVYSYGAVGGMEIKNSEFINNAFTSIVDDVANYYGGSLPTPKVYGTVTVDTGLISNGLNILTLTATAGNATVFLNNKITEGANPSRYNSLYFGVVEGYSTDSYGNITKDTDDAADSDAQLIVNAEAGGYIYLSDPIAVNQNDGKTFNMTVQGGGYFYWGGENTFALDGATGAVTLESGSNTIFMNDELAGPGGAFGLYGADTSSEAPFDFTLKAGANLLILGDNVMNVRSAALAGNLTFNLDNDGLSSLGDYSSVSSPPPALLTFADTDDGEIDFSGATVSLANFREGPALPSDAVFYLVATDGADDIAALPENQSAYARQGLTRGYNFIVDDMADGQTPDKQYLVARLVYTGPAPEARIINEGRIAGLAFVSNSAGWLADHSYESADLNIREKEGGWEYASFGGADAGWQRIETGAHLDLTSSHLMLGRTAKRVREDGSLLYGGFIDAGFGHYGVRGDFGGAGQVSGRGNLRTVGLGFMTRRVRADGLRLEASLRGGQLRNRFRSYELTDTDGNITRYDLRVPYFGGHLGIGKEKKLSGKDRLDILLRYYYARQNGKTITLHTDERVDFAADESHRLRLGTRFTRQKNEYRYWYVGAALEYEFDGKARGIADGQYRLGEPDMGGLTGVLEVGGVAKPKPDSRFSAEYGVQFYAGKRSGLSGGIRLAWRF